MSSSADASDVAETLAHGEEAVVESTAADTVELMAENTAAGAKLDDVYWSQWETLREGFSNTLLEHAQSQKAMEAGIELDDEDALSRLIAAEGHDPAGLEAFRNTPCDCGPMTMLEYAAEAAEQRAADMNFRQEFQRTLDECAVSVQAINYADVAAAVTASGQARFLRVGERSGQVQQLIENPSEVLERDGDAPAGDYTSKRDELVSALEASADTCISDGLGDLRIREGIDQLLTQKRKVDDVGEVTADARRKIDKITGLVQLRKEAVVHRASQIVACTKTKDESYHELKETAQQLSALLAQFEVLASAFKFRECRYNMQKIRLRKLSEAHEEDVNDLAQFEADAETAKAELQKLVEQTAETNDMTSQSARTKLVEFVSGNKVYLEEGAADRKKLEVLCDRRAALENARIADLRARLAELEKELDQEKAKPAPKGMGQQAANQKMKIAAKIRQLEIDIPAAKQALERHQENAERIRVQKTELADQVQGFYDLEMYGGAFDHDAISHGANSDVDSVFPDFTPMFAVEDEGDAPAVEEGNAGALVVQNPSAASALLAAYLESEEGMELLNKHAEKRERQRKAMAMYESKQAPAAGGRGKHRGAPSSNSTSSGEWVANDSPQA